MTQRNLPLRSFLLVTALSAGLFAYLYSISYRTVLQGARDHALGIATALAAGIQAEEVQSIQRADDQHAAGYQRIQGMITQIIRHNPDVLHAYVMRRATGPEARPSDMVYVVDQITADHDRDGIIAEREHSVPVGSAYDASPFPAMVAAWDSPTAEQEPMSDPPYPDSLSAYAPVKNAQNETVAIVGCDIAASNISRKTLWLQMVHGAGFLLINGLLMVLMHLYSTQRRLAHERKDLVKELQDTAAKVKTLSGLLPICANCKSIRDENGDWQAMEKYVRQRSEADFSHGLCPACARKLYPDYTL